MRLRKVALSLWLLSFSAQFLPQWSQHPQDQQYLRHCFPIFGLILSVGDVCCLFLFLFEKDDYDNPLFVRLKFSICACIWAICASNCCKMGSCAICTAENIWLSCMPMFGTIKLVGAICGWILWFWFSYSSDMCIAYNVCMKLLVNSLF